MTKKVYTTDNELLKHGLASVPVAVLKDKRIGHLSARLYAVLCSYAWGKKEVCNPGLSKLSKDIGASVRTVIRALGPLKEAGYLDVKKGGDGKTNTYTILTKNRSAKIDTSEVSEVTKTAFRHDKPSHIEYNNEKNNKDNPAQQEAVAPDLDLEVLNTKKRTSKDLVIYFARCWETYKPHKDAGARFTICWGKYLTSMSRLLATDTPDDIKDLIDVFFTKSNKAWILHQPKTFELFYSKINLLKAEALSIAEGGNNGKV